MKRHLLILVSLTLTIAAIGQNTISSKDSAKLAKLENYVVRAEAKMAKAEVKMAYADSLIESGTTLIEENDALLDKLYDEIKQLDGTYKGERKPLEKATKTKDRDDARQAATELKAFDAKYKADAKVLTTKEKVLLKLMSKGESNFTKGKTYKKTAKTAVKEAQKALDEAQKNLNEGKAEIEGEPEEKKSKKKK